MVKYGLLIDKVDNRPRLIYKVLKWGMAALCGVLIGLLVWRLFT